MTSTDWPQVDAMPSMGPANDIFDADILGDELMDIYNAAVGGGDDDAMNEIPSLLSSPDDNVKKEDTASNDADAQDGVVAAPSIDDGLGAFRPSTSFNDLTTLLPPSASADTNSAENLSPPVVPSKAAQEKKTAENPKKRGSASSASGAPPAKRKASSSKKSSAGGTSSKSKSKASGDSSTQKEKPDQVRSSTAGTSKQKQGDTPDPLTGGGRAQKKQQSEKASTAKTAKGVIRPPIASAPGPVVVTPRVPNNPIEPAAVAAPPAAGTAPAPQTVPSATMATSPAPAPTSPGTAPAQPTEADFKSVAQAAVYNLMNNAGGGNKAAGGGADAASTGSADASADSKEKIDTSTEHIKALTGNNWVSVCSGGEATSASNTGAAAAAAADKMNNRARRQNLTPDERARQNRDRNREHARNTRLRKKAYVEELKRTLTALVSQRDAADLEKKHVAHRELEQREVRFRVIEEFLKLRGRDEANPARWSAILEDGFSMTLPLTDYRNMVHPVSGRTEFDQVLTGVSEAMADSNLFASFLQSLGRSNVKGVVSFSYQCDRKNFFMDNCMAVMEWSASSQGAVAKGAPSELVLKGTLRAKFSPASNKLISVSFSYDTGVVMTQLNHILKSNEVNSDEAVEAAAAAAASEADAILDSLQMPHIEPTSVPSNVTVLQLNASSGAASITDVEREDSSDESNADADDTAKGDTRQSTRD